MKKRYDVIIIGGGIGGLTVGNYLVKRGLDCVIFEKNSKAGGYMASFQRKGYIFEGGLTSFGSNGIVFPILEELGFKTTEFILTGQQFITESFNVQANRSFQELQQVLEEEFFTERKKLKNYFSWVEMVCEGFKSLFQIPVISGKWGETLSGLMTFSYKNMPFLKFLFQSRKITNREWHDRFFSNSRLKTFFNGLGYPTMTALVTGGMWYSFKEDYWYPKGGMRAFSQLFVNGFLSAGGEICYNSEVKQIHIQNGKAVGIVLRDGQRFYGNVIVSNVDLNKTYSQLLTGNVNKAFLSKLKNSRPSESMFTVFLGLRGKGFPASIYSLKSSHSILNVINDEGQSIELAINIPTIDDPSLSALGESVIVSCFDEYDDWVGLKNHREQYIQKKKEKTDQILNIVKAIIPNLDQRLEVVESATPLTYYHYTGSFKGATAGWSWNPHYQRKFNWKKEGKIPNLYLVGQWLYNPGGVPTAMLSARIAAMKIINFLFDG